MVPTIRALQEQADVHRTSELERARRLLASGASPDQVVDQLARALTNKFLHAPTQALNHASGAERTELLAVLQRVYRLPDTPGDTH